MSKFKITGPGIYKTRLQERVDVVAYSEPRLCWLGFNAKGNPAAWADDGLLINRMAHESALSGDIIAPWTEPKTGTVWVNAYADGHTSHSSRDQADRQAQTGRLACAYVNWTEGEGL